MSRDYTVPPPNFYPNPDNFIPWFPPPTGAPPPILPVPPTFSFPPPSIPSPLPVPSHVPPPNYTLPQHQSFLHQNLGNDVKSSELTCGNTPQCFISSPVQISNTEVSAKAEKNMSTDELWISNWLSQRKIFQSADRKLPQQMKIFEARCLLQDSIIILEELKKAQNMLLSKYSSMTLSEWHVEVANIKKKKAEISEKLQKLSDPSTLKMLKVSIDRRHRKRKSQKRRKENWQFLKLEKTQAREKLHQEIDAWLENMQESVEKAKMEESLKVEADAVLSDVTKKRTDARRQLAMLSSLERLRKLRGQAATARGEHVSVELGACFSRVIDNLRSLWEEKIEEYALEEKGLRVMLTDAVDERKIRYDRTVLAQWKKLLFGSSTSSIHPFYTVAEESVEGFIDIRRSWDKCVVPPSAPMSSAIPVGWVLPTNPSSAAWEAVLSTENQEY